MMLPFGQQKESNYSCALDLKFEVLDTNMDMEYQCKTLDQALCIIACTQTKEVTLGPMIFASTQCSTLLNMSFVTS